MKNKTQKQDQDQELLEQLLTQQGGIRGNVKPSPKNRLAPLKKIKGEHIGLLVAVVSMIAAIIVIPEFRIWLGLDKIRQNDNLQIVDIGLADVDVLADTERDNTVISHLDVRLRNIGQDVAYIKQIQISIENIWDLDAVAVCALGAVPPSAYYEAHLPSERVTDPIVVNVSQEIKPNAVDRFEVSLVTPRKDSQKTKNLLGSVGVLRIYQMRISILYNEQQRSTIYKDISILSKKLPVHCWFLEKGSQLSDNDRNTLINLSKTNTILSPLLQILTQMAKDRCIFGEGRFTHCTNNDCQRTGNDIVCPNGNVQIHGE